MKEEVQVLESEEVQVLESPVKRPIGDLLKDYNFKKTNIKGKDYVEVHERIKFLRITNQDYEISTEANYNSELTMWLVKATLTLYLNSGKFRTFTGHAQEIVSSSMINKTSALENAETSAVGRCVGMAGIGLFDGIASVDEMNKAHNRTTQGATQNNTQSSAKSPVASESKKTTRMLTKNEVENLWKGKIYGGNKIYLGQEVVTIPKEQVERLKNHSKFKGDE